MTRVLVVGEAIGDFIPRDGEGRFYEAVLGGSGFNTSLALTRCGASAAYETSLSRDALGQRFHAALTAEGVDVDRIRWSEAPSAVAVIAPLGRDGVPRFGLHLAETAQVEPAATTGAWPAGFDHLHATSFEATVGAPGEASLRLLGQARAAGASTSYDLNIRPSALPAHDEALAAIADRVALADIIKASLEDLAWAFPGEQPEDVARRWLAGGARLVLATMGADGVLASTANGHIHRPAPVVEVSDTVGAGDSFVGAALAWLAAHGRLGQGLASLSTAELDACLGFAVQVAAETCTRPGCDPPRRSPGPPEAEA